MILFYDTETTGVSTINDKIVQLSVIKTDYDFKIIDKKKILINPGIPIPKEASDVHGITDEMVKDKPHFIRYAKSIRDYMVSSSILCGYNINSFDTPLLSEEINRAGLPEWPEKTQKHIDCFAIYKNREKRDLASALKFYAGKDIEGAHDAENDVIATIDVLKGQMIKYNIDFDKCIEESSNPDSIDFAGTLIMKDGIACYNIGKTAKGKPITSDRGFGEWMLRGEFTSNTKNILRAILNS